MALFLSVIIQNYYDIFIAGSFLELDCSVDEGQLAWWATGAHHPAIRQHVVAVLDVARGKLARENWTLTLYSEGGTEGSPLALVGQGGRLMDILAENEFDKVIIRCDPYTRDLLMWSADAERLPGLTSTFQLKSSYQILQFQSAETARAALKELKEVAVLCEINELSVAPWKPMSGRPLQQAAFELRVNVPRRQNQDMAFVRFKSESEAAAAFVKLLGSAVKVETRTPGLTETVQLLPNRKDDQKSLFCWLRKDRGSRAKDVTEERLLEAIRKRGVEPLGVRIPKEKEYENSPDAPLQVHSLVHNIPVIVLALITVL